MQTLVVTIIVLVGFPQERNEVVSCREDRQASSIVYHMAELPQDIREDLLRITDNQIGERPQPIRRSHVIVPEEAGALAFRFYRALRRQNLWYVQYERALFFGVQTIGYMIEPGRASQRSALVQFNGPPCETIRAAFAGVTPSTTGYGEPRMVTAQGQR